ncbi:hypothetical protein HDV57DRAFT_447541 [Trichoderma longibrachiatum]
MQCNEIATGTSGPIAILASLCEAFSTGYTWEVRSRILSCPNRFGSDVEFTLSFLGYTGRRVQQGWSSRNSISAALQKVGDCPFLPSLTTSVNRLLSRDDGETQTRPGATTTRRAAASGAVQPVLRQSITITRDPATDSYHVARSALVLSFRLFFLPTAPVSSRLWPRPSP